MKSGKTSISSNSWGSTIYKYTQTSYDIDDYAYENKNFVILFAAGNDGEFEY